MDVIARMSALAQPTRLEAMVQLMEADEIGLSVGELAERTSNPPNTMSTHLSILARVGLVGTRRDGRRMFYSARPSAVAEVADFLVRELCHAR